MQGDLSKEGALIGSAALGLVVWGLLRERGFGGQVSQAAIRALYQPAAFLPRSAPPPSGPFTVHATYRLRAGDETVPMRWTGDWASLAAVVHRIANCNLDTAEGFLAEVDCHRITVLRGAHVLAEYWRSPRVAPGRRWVRRGRDLGELDDSGVACGPPFCTMDPERLAFGGRSCLEAPAGALSGLLPGGRAAHRSPTSFDPAELRRGAMVELEHTSDLSVATEIAMDHLVEDPRYYDKLLAAGL